MGAGRTERIRNEKNAEVKQAYRVDLASLRHLLKDAVEAGKEAKPVIISMLTAEGKIERVEVYSNPVMDKYLAERHQLGSYVGAGINDPSKYIRFSILNRNNVILSK
ncbi:hypothetical protein DRF65_27185 [Chryseobacterium pennae]|uniref:Uncharacterized protein n=1 Tax=Chryseobacterium pennae TaxID=2258962 RepID=A0A3D9C110_9FLAO|nr:hypothetical protein [Chryseobacterium pennae]REC59216.1 hypothetical protein DRF65_27185 [Chryseobacterium pennae]